MSLDPDIIIEIAAELGISPAFVEKDWHSVQVLKTLASIQNESITTIFSGGTSLSKGYGLLKRFSEDLDFRCRYQNENSGHQQRKLRSTYRAQIISTMQNVGMFTLNEAKVQTASNYIKLPLSYPQIHAGHAALRPNLEVEFSFTQPSLPPVEKPIQSFLSLFTGEEPETKIFCLSPVETGADKLSALTWRVLKRDRTQEKDDPTMIRHLHDLCALESILNNESELFVQTAETSFECDQKTGNRSTEQSFSSSMKGALKLLKSDSKYKTEYSQFVDAMSYADDSERIDFKTALNNLEILINHFN